MYEEYFFFIFKFMFVLFRTRWRGEPLDENFISFWQSFGLQLFIFPSSVFEMVNAVSFNVLPKKQVHYCY